MLEIRHVSRAFGGRNILEEIQLSLSKGEILCLLGPSGCGKTTLLRIIAGLERVDSGDVLLDGHSLLGVPVHQRGFGLMFQDFALFPHLSVANNVGFGLKMQGEHHIARQKRISEVLQQVGLAGFDSRDVTQLSGGERQRVALARSLVLKPRLLMLDEPLGSLDEVLKGQLANDLRAIIKKVGLTAIYVTHDQREAFAISDRIALMNAGRVEQLGSSEALYRKPRTEFAARFLGLNNIIPAFDLQNGQAMTAIGQFPVNGRASAVLLHPAGLRLTSWEDQSGIPVVVRERVFAGEHYTLLVEHIESGIILSLFVPAYEGNSPEPGQTVRVLATTTSVIGLEQ